LHGAEFTTGDGGGNTFFFGEIARLRFGGKIAKVPDVMHLSEKDAVFSRSKGLWGGASRADFFFIVKG